MILADTNVLVAAANQRDENHARATHLLRHIREPVGVVQTVVAEACYLIDKYAGQEAEADLLDAFAIGELVPVPLQPPDFGRMAELVRQYADLHLGGTDASVVAAAERLRITVIATFDNHFRIVRPRHAATFHLIP